MYRMEHELERTVDHRVEKTKARTEPEEFSRPSMPLLDIKNVKKGANIVS